MDGLMWEPCLVSETRKVHALLGKLPRPEFFGLAMPFGRRSAVAAKKASKRPAKGKRPGRRRQGEAMAVAGYAVLTAKALQELARKSPEPNTESEVISKVNG
jgi:hypothetical protein